MSVKWIKITPDIFQDDKMLVIEAMPNGKIIQLVWIKILCLAGRRNNNGFLTVGKKPYTDEMLADYFKVELEIVKEALKTFQELEMVEVVDGVYMISNWLIHQNEKGLDDLRKSNADRQKRFRDKQKDSQNNVMDNVSNNVTNENSNVTRNVTDNVTVTRDSNVTDNVNHSYSYSISNSINNIRNSISNFNNTNNTNNKNLYNSIASKFNEICVSFPKVMGVTKQRQQALDELLKDFTLTDFEKAFNNAEKSPFLKGKVKDAKWNNREGTADFDWIINEKNFVKVLEGKYTEMTKTEKQMKQEEEWLIKEGVLNPDGSLKE